MLVDMSKQTCIAKQINMVFHFSVAIACPRNQDQPVFISFGVEKHRSQIVVVPLHDDNPPAKSGMSSAAKP